jgi:ribosomal-protein-alanine N-acetyltransferase
VALVIRPADDADAERILADCFPDSAPDEIADGFTDDAERFALVAEAEGRIAAHAALLRSGDTGWVANVAVNPEFRGRGIARQLLDRLAVHASEIGLSRLCIHVREDNLSARRAYEKAGFRCVGQDGMRGAQLRYERSLTPNSGQ